MAPRIPRLSAADVHRFYMALAHLLRNYQFRDRDRQTICGITVTQCYALEFIVHERRLTILEIGSRLALNKSNASRVVEALEAVGVVARAPDRANHRIRWIEPTVFGRQLHAEITAGLKRDYARILAPFPRSFVQRVTALLGVLAQRARQPRRREGGSRSVARPRPAGRAYSDVRGTTARGCAPPRTGRSRSSRSG